MENHVKIFTKRREEVKISASEKMRERTSELLRE